MNTFAAYPAAALLVANQTVSDRVEQAQARAQARAARAERRAERRDHRAAARQTPPTAPLPWWAFRFVRPAD
ncbi:MAG TPA: hypothetical protein VHR35_01140 [Nocardioides sp.]|jgi:hypothetical protein|nr:hypothetical protein [Nocardioides sp.]